MKRCILPLAVCFSGVLLAARTFSQTEEAAETALNPYLGIVERNPFALKPPPPPPTNSPTAEVTAAAKVILTGIHSIIGPTAALLEIEDNEPGAKTKTVRKPILREGERDGSVEVLSIDIKNSIVRIRNGQAETELTFQKPNPAGAPPVPGAPAGAVPPPVPPPLGNPSGMTAAAANNAPILVTRDPANAGNSGVHMFGGSTAAPASAASVSPASSSVTSFGGGNTYNRSGSLASSSGGGTSLYGGAGTTGSGTSLSMNRPIRTDAPQTQVGGPQLPSVPKEVIWQRVEQDRAAAIAAGSPHVSIIPPTPYTRELYGGQRPEVLIQPTPPPPTE